VNILKWLLSNGLLCWRCGTRRLPWRDLNWACPSCDLTK
jgi:uncharacterized OB-fold protein